MTVRKVHSPRRWSPQVARDLDCPPFEGAATALEHRWGQLGEGNATPPAAEAERPLKTRKTARDAGSVSKAQRAGIMGVRALSPRGWPARKGWDRLGGALHQNLGRSIG